MSCVTINDGNHPNVISSEIKQFVVHDCLYLTKITAQAIVLWNILAWSINDQMLFNYSFSNLIRSEGLHMTETTNTDQSWDFQAFWRKTNVAYMFAWRHLQIAQEVSWRGTCSK